MHESTSTYIMSYMKQRLTNLQFNNRFVCTVRPFPICMYSQSYILLSIVFFRQLLVSRAQHISKLHTHYFLVLPESKSLLSISCHIRVFIAIIIMKGNGKYFLVSYLLAQLYQMVLLKSHEMKVSSLSPHVVSFWSFCYYVGLLDWWNVFCNE